MIRPDKKTLDEYKGLLEENMEAIVETFEWMHDSAKLKSPPQAAINIMFSCFVNGIAAIITPDSPLRKKWKKVL